MYTANVVDTVVFRALGQPPNPNFKAFRQAVRDADAEVWVPATIYKELLDNSISGSSAPVNPYLDGGVKEGWIRVATPLPGTRDDNWDSLTNDTERARYLTNEYLNQQSKYPTTNNWNDSSIVGLVVRLFENNDRMRVITHTADENLSNACVRIPPELGYYDVRSVWYKPPRAVKSEFTKPSKLTW